MLRQISISSLRWSWISTVIVAIVGFSFWMVLRAPVPMAEHMVQIEVRTYANLWMDRVENRIDDMNRSFEQRVLTTTDLDYLQVLTDASDVYRFKLFDADGQVFWSTRSSDIGTFNSKEDFLSLMATGDMLYYRKEVPLSEVDNIGIHTLTSTVAPRQIAEVYHPVIANGQVIGAIEFYTDVSDILDRFTSRMRMLMAVLTGLGTLTITLVAGLIYRTNQRQYRAMHDRSSRENRLLSEQVRLAREVKLLGDLNEWLQSSRSLEELFDMVARFITHILPDAEGSLYVYSNSRDVLDGCISWNGGNHKQHIHPEACWGLRRGRTYEYGHDDVGFTCEHAEPHDGRPYYCFPILAHGETVGLLHLREKVDGSGEFTSSRDLAQMCAEQISMAIANVRMRDQLQDQSVRDPLTGLFNRRHMTESLRKHIANSQRTGQELALIALDVDHFKKFNDTHGHDAGDMILRAVGTVLQQHCDGDEIACRPGGEEFTLILPGCNRKGVAIRAEALRLAIEKIVVRYGEKNLPRVTTSIGTSSFPHHGTMPQELLRAADDALYEAKAAGRNTIIEANPHGMNDVPPLEHSAEDEHWADASIPEGQEDTTSDQTAPVSDAPETDAHEDGSDSDTETAAKPASKPRKRA